METEKEQTHETFWKEITRFETVDKKGYFLLKNKFSFGGVKFEMTVRYPNKNA